MQFFGLFLLCVLAFLLGAFCILIGASWCIASDPSRVSSRISRVGIAWGLCLLAAVLVYFEYAWTAAALIASLLVYALARDHMPRPQVRLFRGLVALAGGCAMIATSFASVWSWIPAYQRWTRERDVAAVAEHSVALIAAANEFQREHERPPDSIAELRSSLALADEMLEAPYGLEYSISPSSEGELQLRAGAVRHFFGVFMYSPRLEVDVVSPDELAWDDDRTLRRGDWIFYDD